MPLEIIHFPRTMKYMKDIYRDNGTSLGEVFDGIIEGVVERLGQPLENLPSKRLKDLDSALIHHLERIWMHVYYPELIT